MSRAAIRLIPAGIGVRVALLRNRHEWLRFRVVIFLTLDDAPVSVEGSEEIVGGSLKDGSVLSARRNDEGDDFGFVEAGAVEGGDGGLCENEVQQDEAGRCDAPLAPCGTSGSPSCTATRIDRELVRSPASRRSAVQRCEDDGEWCCRRRERDG